jgi:transcriptional regulator with XRE-family HTH domain
LADRSRAVQRDDATATPPQSARRVHSQPARDHTALANLARISNPYLSQIERGLHEPSAAILKSIAAGLGIPAEKLFTAAGWLDDGNAEKGETDVETAIRTDPQISSRQKEVLLEVYRGFLRGGDE